MASPTYVAGPFQSLYIGIKNQVTPLQLITLETTGAYEFAETIPREYIPATGQYEQAGAKVLTLNLSFMSIEDLAIKLARGLALNASTVYGTPTQEQYVLLLVDGEDLNTNLYIPCVESIGPFNYQRSKSEQSSISLNYSYQAPDLNTMLWAMGDFTELQTLMPVAQWPF